MRTRKKAPESPERGTYSEKQVWQHPKEVGNAGAMPSKSREKTGMNFKATIKCEGRRNIFRQARESTFYLP